MSWINEVRHDIATLPSTAPVLKKFGITMGVVATLLSFVLWWREWATVGIAAAVCAIGVLFFLCAYRRPRLLQVVYKGWMAIAIVLGSIVSRIILLILFFIVLTPMAIAARIVKKKFMISFKESGRNTYWIQRDRTKKINYEQMF